MKRQSVFLALSVGMFLLLNLFVMEQLAHAQVRDILIKNHPTSSAGPKQSPPGYQLIDVDLNKGAGGDFIYMHYSKQGNSRPITDLYLISSPSANTPPPPGFRKLNVDLNKGAGGNFIYLCVSTDPGKRPIQDLYVAIGQAAMPSGWHSLPYDLNGGCSKRGTARLSLWYRR